MYLVRQAWANSVDPDEMPHGKELCLNTKGKYSKVTNTEIKSSILSKSVKTIIFVEFIDQLIDYPINCASLKRDHPAYPFEALGFAQSVIS